MSDPNADHEFELTYNGQTYSIATYNVRDDDDGRLLYDVVVRDSSGLVVLADDFIVYNPPVMVPDGTTYTVTDDMGETMTLANMREDPVAAFEMFTRETVLLHLKAA